MKARSIYMLVQVSSDGEGHFHTHMNIGVEVVVLQELSRSSSASCLSTSSNGGRHLTQTAEAEEMMAYTAILVLGKLQHRICPQRIHFLKALQAACVKQHNLFPRRKPSFNPKQFLLKTQKFIFILLTPLETLLVFVFFFLFTFILYLF